MYNITLQAIKNNPRPRNGQVQWKPYAFHRHLIRQDMKVRKLQTRHEHFPTYSQISRLLSHGEISFHIAALKELNILPLTIKTSPTHARFFKYLKVYLIKKYCDWRCILITLMLNLYLPIEQCHHHHQGVFLSLRRNSSLHALHNFLSFAMWLHVGPTYRIKSSHHLVLGRPRGLLCPRGIHSVTLIAHLLSLLLATWPPICVCFLLCSW